MEHRPFVRGSDTSEEAAMLANVKGDAPRVLAHIKVMGATGATDDEIEVALGLSHQTASARRRGLVLGGKIKDSGKRRLTRRNRKATVWVVADDVE